MLYSVEMMEDSSRPYNTNYYCVKASSFEGASKFVQKELTGEIKEIKALTLFKAYYDTGE